MELELAIERKKVKELKKENAMLKKNARQLFKNVSKSEVGLGVKKAQPGRVMKKKTFPKLCRPTKAADVPEPKSKIPKSKTSRPTKAKSKQDLSSDSENEDAMSEKELCDDDEMDDLPLDCNENLCFICEEFGKDGEEWYRCVSCGLWIHALCSGADSAEDFLCDQCLRH